MKAYHCQRAKQCCRNSYHPCCMSQIALIPPLNLIGIVYLTTMYALSVLFVGFFHVFLGRL